MPTQAAPAASSTADLRPLLARISRDQGPEFEQTLNFAALTQIATPTSLRTDRKIKWIDLHMRGRFTNDAGVPTFRTAPLLLSPNGIAVNSSVIFSLLQQIRVFGQHLKYGSQTVFQMRGEAAAEWVALMLPNYIPQYTVSANGAAQVRFGAFSAVGAQTNDFDFNLPIPLFPSTISPADAVMYCLHGPDWPGNLYVELTFGNGTSLATANPPLLFAAFGGGGVPTVDILTERPLLGKEYMAAIRGAITFRQQYTQQPTAAVAAGGGAGVKLSDLTVGKDTTRILLKTGTAAAGSAAGVVVFGALSDQIVTRTFFSLDNRQLRFQNANADSALQDYSARTYGNTIPIGYKIIDFIDTPAGLSVGNPKAAFGSSQLTAARKFELDGDVVAGANQIAEVTQEMVLGAPGITS